MYWQYLGNDYERWDNETLRLMLQQEIGQHVAPDQGSFLVLFNIKSTELDSTCVENCKFFSGNFLNWSCMRYFRPERPRDCEKCGFERKAYKLQGDRRIFFFFLVERSCLI